MRYLSLFFVFALCSMSLSAQKSVPLVYDVENTSADASPILPGRQEARQVKALTDPFEWSDGKGRVKKFADWRKRRGEIAKEIQHYEIGEKPVVPPRCVGRR